MELSRWVECLPSVHEVLGSISSTPRRNKVSWACSPTQHLRVQGKAQDPVSKKKKTKRRRREGKEKGREGEREKGKERRWEGGKQADRQEQKHTRFEVHKAKQ